MKITVCSEVELIGSSRIHTPQQPGQGQGQKGELPKDFKQGDFVKLFGQIRTSVDDNGKEHTNIRILSSKLLKAKEQMKGRDEKKESVLGAIKKYQAEDKEKPKEKKETSKEAER